MIFASLAALTKTTGLGPSLAIVTSLSACLGFISAVPGQIPDELHKAVLERSGFKSAHVRFRISSSKLGWQNYETRYSNGTILEINTGDDDGIMGVKTDGSQLFGVGYGFSPRLSLVDPDARRSVFYLQGSCSAGFKEAVHNHVSDIRTVGLQPWLVPGKNPVQIEKIWLDMFPKNEHWRSTRSDRLIEVEAHNKIDEESYVWKWTIDPARNSAVTSTSWGVVRDGGIVDVYAKCETAYELIDGRWFPVRTTGGMTTKGQALKSEYQLVEASFDRPDHPKTLSVEMLRIPPGSFVGMENNKGELKVWSGSNVVSRKEWLELRRSRSNAQNEESKLQNAQETDKYRYPAWWYDDSGKMGISNLESNPDAWEAYVRRWCMKNSVDDTQRTEAKSILESYRKEARDILAKRAPELDKIEALLKDKKLDPKKADEARAEGQRLLAPIGEIFTRLKARLESLLLQKQISAKQPTTAPAAKP